MDVYAAGVVVWEMLTQRKLFEGNEASVLYDILESSPLKPSEVRPDIPPELDAAIMKALARDRDQRFDTAIAFADALEAAVRPATQRAIGEWVKEVAGPEIESRRQGVAELERTDDIAPLSLPLGNPTTLTPTRVTELAVPGGPDDIETRVEGQRAAPSSTSPTRRKGTQVHWLTWVAPLVVGAGLAVLYFKDAPPSQATANSTDVSVPAATSADEQTSTGRPDQPALDGELSAPPVATSGAPTADVAGTARTARPNAGPPPYDENKALKASQVGVVAAMRCADGAAEGSSLWLFTFLPAGGVDAKHVNGPNSPCVTASAMQVQGIGAFQGSSRSLLKGLPIRRPPQMLGPNFGTPTRL